MRKKRQKNSIYPSQISGLAGFSVIAIAYIYLRYLLSPLHGTQDRQLKFLAEYGLLVFFFISVMGVSLLITSVASWLVLRFTKKKFDLFATSIFSLLLFAFLFLVGLSFFSGFGYCKLGEWKFTKNPGRDYVCLNVSGEVSSAPYLEKSADCDNPDLCPGGCENNFDQEMEDGSIETLCLYDDIVLTPEQAYEWFEN